MIYVYGVAKQLNIMSNDVIFFIIVMGCIIMSGWALVLLVILLIEHLPDPNKKE